MSNAIKISNISIKGIGKTFKISLNKSIKEIDYLEYLLNNTKEKYKEQLDNLLEQCDSENHDFLMYEMFYTMGDSVFHSNCVITDKLAIEVQRNVMIIKAISGDDLDNIILNNIATKQSITLKELCSIIEMTYEPLDVSIKYKKLNKVYKLKSLIEDYTFVLMITNNDRYMVHFYYKDFNTEPEEDDYIKFENPLGYILEDKFEYLEIDI